MSAPSWLVANVVAQLQDLVAILDTIVAANPLDPDKAARFIVAVPIATPPAVGQPAPSGPVTGIGDALVALYNAIPLGVVAGSGIDAGLMQSLAALALAIGDAMDPAAAADAFATAADTLPDPGPPPTQSANRLQDAANAAVVVRAMRLILLAPYAYAAVSQPYTTRPDGQTARADCVQRFERELELCAGALDAPVADAAIALRDKVVDFLSREILDLAPVVTVSANLPLPAVWWAWHLYRDPARAAELIARNGVPHPGYMPLSFEALAPTK